MNGYELVEQWVKEEKRTSFLDNMFKTCDEKIALEILKQYYNAKYEPSDDFHCCGNWIIDNPYVKKIKGYRLRYSIKGSGKWETLSCVRVRDFPMWQDYFAKEIIRLDSNEKNESEIATMLKQNFYYVSKQRFWEIVEIELYE